MKVVKWGNSLAVRLPAWFVAQHGLAEGQQVDVVARQHKPEFSDAERAEAIRRLRKLRGSIPADFKFDREELYRRDSE